MVTFRFYVVSIVAFFLALAVGVVMGSVLDDGISSSLKDRLEGVERNLDDTVTVMDQKNREIDALEQYVDESAPFLVTGRLSNTSTLVVADEGVDSARAKAMVMRLREAGSNTPGIVWLDKSWDLDDQKVARTVAKLVGSPGSTLIGLEGIVWDRLLGDIGSSGSPGSVSTTTSTIPDGSAPNTNENPTSSTTVVESTDPTGSTSGSENLDPIDFAASPFLSALQESSLVRFEAVGGKNPTGGPQLDVVVVTGTDSKLNNPGLAVSHLAEAAAKSSVPAVMAEIEDTSSDEPITYGKVLKDVLTDESRALFSTVNNAGQTSGQVATVLALEQYGDNAVGHYGHGPSVDGLLPPWPGP